MEKIKGRRIIGEFGDAEEMTGVECKINEIIDELHTINVQKVTIDRLVEEDRLKTLEDMFSDARVSFSALEDKIESVRELLVRSKLVRPEDLWDEQNEANVNRSFYVNSEPTVIDMGSCTTVPPKYFTWTGGGKGEPTVKECSVDCKEQNSKYCPCDFYNIENKRFNEAIDKEVLKGKKIEEIIKQLHMKFILSDGMLYQVDSDGYTYEAKISYIESWLRDKLKSL